MFSVWDDLRRAVFSIFPFSSRMHFIHRYRQARGERSARYDEAAYAGFTREPALSRQVKQHVTFFNGRKDKRMTCYLTRPPSYPSIFSPLPVTPPSLMWLCVFVALRKLFNIRSNYSLWRRIKSFLLGASPAPSRPAVSFHFELLFRCNSCLPRW